MEIRCAAGCGDHRYRRTGAKRLLAEKIEKVMDYEWLCERLSTYREQLIPKNPMANVEMMKKSNYLSAQNKEKLSECDTRLSGIAEGFEM